MWNIPETLPTAYLNIPVTTPKLPINPNGNWDKLSGNRDINKLSHIVLHHDGMAKSRFLDVSDDELMKRIANNHIKLTSNHNLGENFPYHIYIRSGKVYLTNPITYRTYGARNNNDYTVHICVAGDYKDFDTLTDPDRLALHLAIVIAKASMTKYAKMVGHDDLVATSCPGYSVKEIEDQVNQLEMEISLMEQPKSKADRAYKVANQILYLYKMFAEGKDANGNVVNDGQRSWALLNVLKLEEEMKRLGLLK